MDEVINNVSNHFSVSTDKQQKTLEQYMENTLRKENENYIYDAHSTRVKMWWNTQDD
jgi:hypothetical protein